MTRPSASVHDLILYALKQLTCRPDLSDAPRSANQHAETRHTTISTARFIRLTVPIHFLAVKCRLPKGPGRE